MNNVVKNLNRLLGGLWLCLGCAAAQAMLPPTEAALEIPMLTEAKLGGNFWIQQLAAPDQRLLTPAEQTQWQQQLYQAELLQPFASLPTTYSRAELTRLIQQVSTPPSAPRFFLNKQAVTAADYATWQQGMALDKLDAPQEVRYALVVQRTNVRSFPTTTVITNQGFDADLDRMQETALFTGQWVHVLWQSADKQWAFVRTDHYMGWIQTADIAMASRADVQGFITSARKLVVTGPRVLSSPGPHQAAVALDIGVQLPLLPTPTTLVHGQHPAFSYVVQMPTRTADGRLMLKPTLVARSQDVREGFLPLTQRQLILQAFKFLGERYGWGHGYQARDCSGFIRDIYQSIGLNLPRNTSEQAKMPAPQSLDVTAWSALDKRQQLQRSQAGDLLFIPGHVMMVLGVVAGEVWVIHDVNGLSLRTADGQWQQSKLNGVSVTPLSVLLVSETASYIDVMTHIQRFSKQPVL